MKEIPQLGGLRGLAALTIVVFHAYLFYIVYGPWDPGEGPQVLKWGWIGVDLFFVLSGFLLAIPFLQRPQLVGEARAWGSYVAKRWLRIAPPYYVSIVLALVLAGNVAHLWQQTRDTFLHLVYLHGYDLQTWTTINPVYWTLAIEFQFYLVLPLLAFLFTRRSWWAWFMASAAVTLLWRSYWYDTTPATQWYVHWFPGFLLHFTVGIAAAKLWLSGFQPRRRTDLLLVAALSLFVAVPLVTLTGDYAYVQGTEGRLSNLLLRSLIAVGFAATLLLVASGTGRVARALATAPLRALGDISYSLYLVHVPLLIWMGQRGYLTDLDPVAFMVAETLLALAAATAFYLVVERPSLRLKSWVFNRRPSGSPTARAPSNVPASAVPLVAVAGVAPSPGDAHETRP